MIAPLWEGWFQRRIWRRNKKLIITYRQSQHIKWQYRLYMSWDIQPPDIPPIWALALVKFAIQNTHPSIRIHFHTAQMAHRDWATEAVKDAGYVLSAEASRRQDVGSGVLLASAHTHAHARAPIHSVRDCLYSVAAKIWLLLLLFIGQQCVQLFRTRLWNSLNPVTSHLGT